MRCKTCELEHEGADCIPALARVVHVLTMEVRELRAKTDYLSAERGRESEWRSIGTNGGLE